MIGRDSKAGSGKESVKAATIIDVARLAEASIKTVSRVINADPAVKATTLARVRAAMVALNYTPHPSARTLSGRISTTIGLACPALDTPSGEHLGHNYIMKVQVGALSACARNGHALQLIPCELGRDDLADYLLSTLSAQRIGSLLLLAGVCTYPGLTEALDAQNIPYVVIYDSEIEGDAPRLSADNIGGARAAVEHLLALGHRRIAFAQTRFDFHDPEKDPRRVGYLSAMREAGVPVLPDHLISAEAGVEGGERAFDALFALAQPPTAIFAHTDNMAIGLLRAARSAGVQVPQDLSVVGFDDFEFASLVQPALTTVHQSVERLGFEGADLVVRLARGRRDGTVLNWREEVLCAPCHLVLRESTGPVGTLR